MLREFAPPKPGQFQCIKTASVKRLEQALHTRFSRHVTAAIHAIQHRSKSLERHPTQPRREMREQGWGECFDTGATVVQGVVQVEKNRSRHC
jgi:uncharacterized protein (DUF1697 family)